MQDMEAIFFNKLLHILFHLFFLLRLIVDATHLLIFGFTLNTESNVHELKYEKLAVSIVFLFN